LNQLVSRNDQLTPTNNGITTFHAKLPPSISILNYLQRIVKYIPCSTECFVLGLVYIDRIIQKHAQLITINSFNVHRLVISSILVASKFNDDNPYNNAFYARVGGFQLQKLIH